MDRIPANEFGAFCAVFYAAITALWMNWSRGHQEASLRSKSTQCFRNSEAVLMNTNHTKFVRADWFCHPAPFDQAKNIRFPSSSLQPHDLSQVITHHICSPHALTVSRPRYTFIIYAPNRCSIFPTPWTENTHTPYALNTTIILSLSTFTLLNALGQTKPTPII